MPFSRDLNNSTQLVLRLGAATEVAVTSVAAQSGTFSTRIVRLCSTTNCRIAIGPNPTAVATGTYLSAGEAEYFQVGALDKVSVIRESADGKLSITEVG